MTTNRLLKVQQGLTAKERARLALQQWKADLPADRSLLAGMEEHESARFYELVGLVNGAHQVLGLSVVVLETVVAGLEAEVRLFARLWRWSLQADEIFSYLLVHTHEPMTESEHAAQLAAMRAEWLTIEEAVEWLDDGEGRRPGRKTLRDAIRAGQVISRKTGGATVVELGSLADWHGDTLNVIPERGFEVEIRPDDEHEGVRQARAARTHAIDTAVAFRAFAAGISGPVIIESETATFASELIASLRARVGQPWREARAVAQVADECAERFGGDDVLHPCSREALDELLPRLARLGRVLQITETPEPGEEILDNLREHVETWSEP